MLFSYGLQKLGAEVRTEHEDLSGNVGSMQASTLDCISWNDHAVASAVNVRNRPHEMLDVKGNLHAAFQLSLGSGDAFKIDELKRGVGQRLWQVNTIEIDALYEPIGELRQRWFGDAL